ncbi:hypothetical protein RN001_004293 [Aquatica leii]|uniref:Uncharacterized protein n=1 Tax=Aquatica leii TaxID=1421715 RepID=A0AAN7PB67_9COLE|nr:hypothetical protein RN001_004293 [Aquatica leii]
MQDETEKSEERTTCATDVKNNKRNNNVEESERQYEFELDNISANCEHDRRKLLRKSEKEWKDKEKDITGSKSKKHRWDWEKMDRDSSEDEAYYKDISSRKNQKHEINDSEKIRENKRQNYKESATQGGVTEHYIETSVTTSEKCAPSTSGCIVNHEALPNETAAISAQSESWEIEMENSEKIDSLQGEDTGDSTATQAKDEYADKSISDIGTDSQ